MPNLTKNMVELQILLQNIPNWINKIYYNMVSDLKNSFVYTAGINQCSDLENLWDITGKDIINFSIMFWHRT